MSRETLIVALGEDRYRIERPWGALPTGGKVTDVAIDGQGRVAVLSRSDPYDGPDPDPVALLDPRDGSFVASFGREDLADAHKIACDPAGRLWVVDRDAHQILCFSSAGQVVARLGGRHMPGAPFEHPTDLSFARDGRIVVSDGYAAGRIHVFAPDLTPLLRFGEVGQAPGAFTTPHGIQATRDGHIVVADRENNRAQIFDMEGRLRDVWTGFSRPSDVAEEPDGTVLVIDGIPTLTRISTDGRRRGRCRPSLNGPHGMCCAADGTIYLAEGNPSRITRLVPIR
jgi:streptogramin lyase